MRLPSLVGLSLLILPLPAPASFAGSEPSSCQGQPATVVVTGGQNVQATEGPDVIVVTGRDAQVDALGGDDLICVLDVATRVRAGAGNDVVVATGPPGDYDAEDAFLSATVELGPGEDRFTGGWEPDAVNGGDTTGDLERDEISTGDGDDFVSSGTPGAANTDVVRTGNGDDTVGFTPFAPSGVLDVGEDDNVAVLTVGDAVTGLGIDVQSQTLTVDATTYQWVGRLHKWRVVGDAGASLGQLVFAGSAQRETLDVAGLSSPAVRVRTRGGADVVHVAGPIASGGLLSLGAGRDSASFGATPWDDPSAHLEEVHVDLTRQRIDYGAPGTASRLVGVERAGVSATTVRVKGNDLANTISVKGCNVRVRAGAGSDTIYSNVSTGCETKIRLAGGPGRDRIWGEPYAGGGGDETMVGGSGDDVLRSGSGDDVLIGGSGDDVLRGGRETDAADGGPGSDRCAAETTRHCESS